MCIVIFSGMFQVANELFTGVVEDITGDKYEQISQYGDYWWVRAWW